MNTGIYSIVRHPQYITFIIWSIAGMLLFQHWIVTIIGIPIIPLTYIDLIKADKVFWGNSVRGLVEVKEIWDKNGLLVNF